VPVTRAWRSVRDWRGFQGLLSRPLLRTAVNLYLVQSAILLVPLITLPYLSRTLAPANLGLLFFSQAYASLATLIVQYGFEFSASREVARVGDDRRKVGEIVAGALSAKLVLVGVSAAIAVGLGLSVPLFRDNPEYLAAAWALSVAQGMSPLWYFLGRERLGAMTLLDIASRVVAVIAIFAFVDAADDGLLVLVIQATTTAAGVAAATAVMCSRVRIPRLRLRTAAAGLREGFQLAMYSAVAVAALYVPSLLVGILATPVQVGYYGVADKLQKVPVAFLWPLSRALYPRINRLLSEDPPRARRLTRTSSVIFVGVGAVAGVALALAAGWLVPLVFGSEYDPAVQVFRVLALAIPFGLLCHVLAYQVLMPLRRDRALNYTTWICAGIRILLAVPLTLEFGAVGMAWAVLAGWVINAAILAGIVLSSSRPLFGNIAQEAAKAR
jgi:PST family polysaccharide transporter